MRILKFLMFNSFVKLYLNGDIWILRLNRRIKCLILEMWYTVSVFFPFVAIPLIIDMMYGDQIHSDFKWTELITIVPFNLMMIGLFNKDFFGGQSVVHRKLGYKVVSSPKVRPFES